MSVDMTEHTHSSDTYLLNGPHLKNTFNVFLRTRKTPFFFPYFRRSQQLTDFGHKVKHSLKQDELITLKLAFSMFYILLILKNGKRSRVFFLKS